MFIDTSFIDIKRNLRAHTAHTRVHRRTWGKLLWKKNIARYFMPVNMNACRCACMCSVPTSWTYWLIKCVELFKASSVMIAWNNSFFSQFFFIETHIRKFLYICCVQNIKNIQTHKELMASKKKSKMAREKRCKVLHTHIFFIIFYLFASSFRNFLSATLLMMMVMVMMKNSSQLLINVVYCKMLYSIRLFLAPSMLKHIMHTHT